MRKRALLTVAGFLLSATYLGACAGGRSVTRVSQTERIDLSGNWNDTDANLVAKEMIEQCLSSPWLERWKREHGNKKPVIRFYPIRNKTSEHINDEFFTKQVESALVNSGEVIVVASRTESADTRGEKEDQAQYASDETAKSQGNETGADFILNGWIISQNDAVEGKQVRAYITTMELIEVETNAKAWIGEKAIKKYVQQSKVGW